MDNKKRVRQVSNGGQEFTESQLDERDQIEPTQQQNMFYQSNEGDMDMISSPTDSKPHHAT